MSDTIYVVYEPIEGTDGYAYHTTFIYVDSSTGYITKVAGGEPSIPLPSNDSVSQKIEMFFKTESQVYMGIGEPMGTVQAVAGAPTDNSINGISSGQTQSDLENWLGGNFTNPLAADYKDPSKLTLQDISNTAVVFNNNATSSDWNDIVNGESQAAAKNEPYTPIGFNSNWVTANGASADNRQVNTNYPYWSPFGIDLGGSLGLTPGEIEAGLAWAPLMSFALWAASFGIALLKSVFAHYEPLVFDLGSGIQTTTLADGTFFDNKNDGFAEKTAWVGANTGILVYDPSDGAITNGSQMFGTATSLSGGGYAVDGFQALAQYDSNSDSVINSSDAAWSNLRIWVDANGNGVTDSGELETMSQAGITSINLTTTNTDTTDANGNYIGKTSTYSLAGGGTAEVADVSFLTAPTLTFATTYVTESTATGKKLSAFTLMRN